MGEYYTYAYIKLTPQHLASQQLPHDYSETEHVSFMIIRLMLNNLLNMIESFIRKEIIRKHIISIQPILILRCIYFWEEDIKQRHGRMAGIERWPS